MPIITVTVNTIHIFIGLPIAFSRVYLSALAWSSLSLVSPYRYIGNKIPFEMIITTKKN